MSWFRPRLQCPAYLPQLLERAMRPDSRRSLGATEQRADFPVAQTFEAAQYQHVPPVGCEPRQRPVEQRAAAIQVRRPHVQLRVVAEVDFGSRLREPAMLDGRVVCDAIEPAAECGASIESPAVFEHAKEDGLREVVRGV